jgi:uncharacterized membrane protein
MNPFDLRAALTEEHAQHVALVHFPIALSLVSWLFDLLGRWRRNPTLAAAAYYNLAGAALSSVVAATTGLAAWQLQLAGARLKGNLRLHLVFALASSTMIWVLWYLRARQRRNGRGPGLRYFALAAVAAMLIAATGRLGGFLSGVN